MVPFLFLASTFSVSLGFFTGIWDYDSSIEQLSDADFTEAFNLTSWIDNETSRDEILNYLLLCPEQDMCIGKKFRRAYSFTLQPACSQCECDDSCVRRSTCCPSKFFRQTPAPDFIQYPLTFDDKQGPTMHCVEPLWNMNDSIVNSGKTYWMIETCPDGAACRTPPSRNITNSTPVTSLFTRETYISIECAFCNNEELSNLVFWEKNKLCGSRSALLSRETPEKFFKTVFAISPDCNVGFYPPASIQSLVNACLTYTLAEYCEDNRRMIDNRTFLIKACREYHIPFYTKNGVYKNVYCALCMYDAKQLNIQNEKDALNTFNPFLTSFSALMDFKEVEKEPIAKTKCAANQLFDEKLNKCQDIQCEPEYVYRDLSCEPVYPMLNKNNYELNVLVVPTNSTHVKTYYLPSVINVLQDIMSSNNLTEYLCRMSVLVPSTQDNRHFAAFVLELSVNHFHSVDFMIKRILGIFSIHHSTTIQLSPEAPSIHFSISVVGQSFHYYGNSLFSKSEMSNRVYVDPMSGYEMLVYSDVSMVSGNEDEPKHRHCGTGDMMAVVAEWYRCPKIRISTTDVKLDVSNFSVCLVDYQACFSSLYFKEFRNKRGVEICLSQYLQASNAMLTKSDDELMKYLSVSCLSLSSFGSLLTLITVTVSNSHKKVADINIIILAVFSILANTVYTFSKFFLGNEFMCICVGVLVHFSWLSVVCWMGLSTFQIFQTFTSFNNVNMKIRSRVICSLLVDICICLIFVSINVSVSYIKSDGESFGYSPRTCYIADPDMILYTFALPVGLIVCINIFMFLVTVFRISGKIAIRKSKDQKTITSYFRLSTITGAAWFFGFLAQFTELQVFSILHTVLNGGHGIFLYAAFGLSPTLNCLSGNQTPQSESFRKNNHTIRESKPCQSMK